jgi:luciferase family oxidoreductase group 1
MKISILDHSPVSSGSTSVDALNNTIELARHAERLGYERFWLAEHHALPSHASPAPEIMACRVAAATSSIRVGSGGVLLSLYPPMKVAEVFRTLAALFPDRIDLGIGRSFGALGLEVQALGHDPEHPPSEEDFQTKLGELLGFLHGFPDSARYAPIGVMPQPPSPPPVCLLGSSVPSAIMAGRNGLPYSFAHFIHPDNTRAAIDAYRDSFLGPAKPSIILGVGVYCADTEEQARLLYTSHQLIRHRLSQNRLGPVVSPEEAVDELAAAGFTEDEPEWPRCVVGSPEQVRDRLTAMAGALGVDELIAMSFIHDHKARMYSFELLAQALEVPQR